MRGIDGPIRANADVTVDTPHRHPIPPDHHHHFEGHGIGKLLVPLVVEREARKEMPVNLSALKERLERGA